MSVYWLETQMIVNVLKHDVMMFVRRYKPTPIRVRIIYRKSNAVRKCCCHSLTDWATDGGVAQSCGNRTKTTRIHLHNAI